MVPKTDLFWGILWGQGVSVLILGFTCKASLFLGSKETVFRTATYLSWCLHLKRRMRYVSREMLLEILASYKEGDSSPTQRKGDMKTEMPGLHTAPCKPKRGVNSL